MYERRRHSHWISYVLHTHRRTILCDTDCRQHFISDLYLCLLHNTQCYIGSSGFRRASSVWFLLPCSLLISKLVPISIYLFLNCCPDSYVRTILGDISIWIWIFWCLANEVIISNVGIFVDWGHSPSINKIVLRVFDDGYEKKCEQKHGLARNSSTVQSVANRQHIVKYFIWNKKISECKMC